MTEPCDLSAADARSLIGDGSLSPVELFDSCQARIEAVNPAVHAVMVERFEVERKEAEGAADAVANDEELPPLHGPPIGVKDANAVGGLRSTYGSLIYKDNVPDEDQGLVTGVRVAGAIVAGKTHAGIHGRREYDQRCLRHDVQSVRHGSPLRWVVRRYDGCACHGDAAARHGVRYWRQCAYSRDFLRQPVL